MAIFSNGKATVAKATFAERLKGYVSDCTQSGICAV